MLRRPFEAICAAMLLSVVCGAGCESSDEVACEVAGGAVAGPADAHCTRAGEPVVQPTRLASCAPGAEDPTPTGGAGGAAADAEAGAGAAPVEEPAAGGQASTGSEYGDPLFGNEADDDDCKYHVAWSVTPVCQDHDTTFQVVVTSKVDGSPVEGAGVRADVFLSATHLAPNSGSKTHEGPGGTYSVGPVRFDASGKWTVRFHFFESCADEPEDSPHAHVAFYVNVP